MKENKHQYKIVLTKCLVELSTEDVFNDFFFLFLEKCKRVYVHP